MSLDSCAELVLTSEMERDGAKCIRERASVMEVRIVEFGI
jgi:hypothetical protein